MDVRRLLLLPFVGLGFVLAVALTPRMVFKPIVLLFSVDFPLCVAALTCTLVQTTGGKRFVGMDRKLWFIGTAVAGLVGCVIGFFVV